MCKHYCYELGEEDRHFVDADEYNNCVLCVVEVNGPMTQAKIAGYMGLSKMRICQLEHQGIAKLKKRLKNLYN